MVVETIMDVALKLLNRHVYSEAQLVEKLIPDFSKPEIKECLEKLRSWGYINDHQFGTDRIHQLQERLKSRSYIIADLEQYGLSKDLVQELIGAYYPETMELVIADRIIIQKSKSNKGSKTKIWIFLIRAGFSENTVHHCFPNIDPT